MSNNKEINNEEAMQDLVDSFTKSILDKGTSDLKDLGIKKLQNFLIDYGYSTSRSKAIADFITSGKSNDISIDHFYDEDSVVARKLATLDLPKMKGVYDFLDFANKWECFFNDMEDLQEKYVIQDENGNRKFTSQGKLALAEKTEDFIDVIDTIIGKLPGSSYYSSLLNALPKYIKNIANLKVEEEKTEILYYMQVLLDDHEFDEIVHELVSERYSENDKRYTLLYDEYMDQIHTLAMQYVVAQEDEDEEVLKCCPDLRLMNALYEYYENKLKVSLDFMDDYLAWRACYENELMLKKINRRIDRLAEQYAVSSLEKYYSITADEIKGSADSDDKKPEAGDKENTGDSSDDSKPIEDNSVNNTIHGTSYKGNNFSYTIPDTISSGFGSPTTNAILDLYFYAPKTEFDTHGISHKQFCDRLIELSKTDPEAANERYQAFLEAFEYMDDILDEEEYEEFKKEADKLKEEIQQYLEEPYKKSQEVQPPRDPLVIDLGTPGIELTGVENGVHFDLDKNGFAEKTAWIGKEDVFLALDRNGNGFIDDGGELFGDQVVMSNGRLAASGFEALKELDTNNDGVINKDDEQFENLRVWVDSDQNGVSAPNELKTLDELGITSISLDHINKDTVDSETGTTVTESSTVNFTNGTTCEIAEHWFEVKPHDTEERDDEGNKIIADSVESFGNVKNLSSAIKDDETGELGALVDAFKASSNYFEKRVLIKKILYFITESDSMEANSRGGNIDARDLHVIEKFMGSDFKSLDGTSIPNSVAAPILKEIYYKVENMYFNLLNNETDFENALNYIYVSKDENGKSKVNLAVFYEIMAMKMALGNDVDNDVYGVASWLKQFDIVNNQNALKNYSNDFRKITEYFNDIEAKINVSEVIYGTESNETLEGTMSGDILWGDSGNDTINAGGGNDFIYGGTGNDILNGEAGDDTYYFEENHGNDIIHDTEGNNKLVFTDGISADDYNMSIDAKLGFVLTHKETGETISMPDLLTNPLNYNFSFEGKSQIEGGIEEREVMEGTEGDDYLEAGDGFNIFYGGDGNDTLAGGKGVDFMYGGDGDDLLLGRNGVNVLFGGNGNDTIYDGDDGSYLSGGDGDDFLYGGGGADVLDGGAGNDYLQGDHGGDTYIFGRGYDTDTINASSDVNTIIIHGYRASSMINTRNANNDLIINFGSADSTDCLIVDHFFDYNSNRDFNFIFDDGTVLGQYDITAKYAPIYGTDGDDWLVIQNGDNGIIHGGAGNDGLSGGSGNDELYGEDGDDTLYGNDGNDILDGGVGNDTLCGGNGTDTYIFAKGYGNDTINEWGSDHSIVKLTDVNSDEVTITDQWGSNLVVSINGTEDTLIISNIKWGQATYSFEFADGSIASVNKDTWELEFSKLPDIPEKSEDELVQENADILSELYADDRLTSDILTETGGTVISDISDSVSVNEDSDEVADQTDIQVMILTENMSAFADEDNVFDNSDVLDSTDDMSMMNQLLVGTQVQ